MAAPNYAALDLGTNTFRLLIAAADPSSTLLYNPLYTERVITHAGGGFQADRGIGDEAQARILTCLQYFSETMKQWNVTEYRAAGTSVFRRAANRASVLEGIRKQTGLHVEVIDGAEEADFSARGAVSQIRLDGPAVIFDIGGGSTEYVVWDQG